MLILLALLGCEAPPATFTEVLPDDRLLLHEEELIARGLPDEPAEWATWLLDEAREANARHTELVLLVQAVTVLPPHYLDPGDERAVVWGPWIIDDEAERIRVEGQGDQYRWAIERQIVDPERVRFDDDGWLADLTGEIDAAGGLATGGSFVLDVDEVGFGVFNRAADALDATPDAGGPGTDEPIGRAALRYSTARSGATLTTFADLDPKVSEVPEEGGITFVHAPGEGGTAHARFDGTEVLVQWAASGGGRADFTTGGRGGTECWSADHQRTFVTGGAGSESDCPFGALP